MKVSAKCTKMQCKVGRNDLFLKYSISAMFYSVSWNTPRLLRCIFYLNPQSPIPHVFCSMILLNPLSKISCVLCLKKPLAPTHTHKHALIQYNDKPLHYETISSQSVQLSDLLSWVFTHGRAHTEASTAQNSPFLFFLLPFTSWVHSAKKECMRKRQRAKESERRRREWAKIKHHLHNVAFVPIFGLFNYHI